MSATDNEVDRLVDIITERVRSRLGTPGLVTLGGGGSRQCTDDSGPGENCEDCGSCVVRRPWSVRAIEQAGAARVAAPSGIGKLETSMAKMIDHTLLKPEARRADVVALCEDARKHRFASVCVNTTWVGLAKGMLSGTDVMVCAVVGFPLGAMAPTAKAYEAKEAVRSGASEIDMVINVGALKSQDYETVFEDICRVVKASAPSGVKVILETALLNEEEKIIGCSLSKLAGAAFVKTSTGFSKGGATVEDVALMRRVVGDRMGVKASGGVRSAEDVEKMKLAGATRIGASASVAIVSGKAAKGGGY